MTRGRTHPWYDVAWPVLAGVAAGVGLVAAYRWTGPMTFLVALALLELTIAPVAWVLLTELGLPVARVAFRVAPAVSVAVLALVGLAESITGWSFLVAGVVAATSPWLRGWARVGAREIAFGWSSEDARTRREFDEIVAHGFGPPDDEPAA